MKAPLALVVLASAAAAQANVIPGTDVALGKMDQLKPLGHEGTYPFGNNGIALASTACNKGSVKVPWLAPMLEDHPFISFLIARELDGRFEQISDYSYVKHGFFALTDDYCDTCQEPPGGGGSVLGLGCSDTYSVLNNGDNYWLGPASEIDPWLGEWDRNCSHFDRGEPAVSPPQDCDGLRSLTVAMADALDPVGHRINVTDQELSEPTARYFYQAYYVVRGEPEADRENNWGSKEFIPSWSPLFQIWAAQSIGFMQEGSVLLQWDGATIGSEKNGNDDGRVYVAVKVTGPTEGRYRYEYVVHNRDNHRGVGSFSIPICSGARIFDAGFRDIDDDPANDWSVNVGATAVTYSTATNPVRWNSLYNFWFDSDAAPVSGSVDLGQHDPGAGLSSLAVSVPTPEGLYNVFLGDGCAAGAAPSLYATGDPAQATLGNPTFGIGSSGNVPGQLHVLVAGAFDGSVALGGGCTQWFGGGLGSGAVILAATTSDAGGVASYAAPVPSSPSFEGTHVNVQGAGVNPSGGPFAGVFELTDGLRVRLGDAIPGCP